MCEEWKVRNNSVCNELKLGNYKTEFLRIILSQVTYSPLTFIILISGFEYPFVMFLIKYVLPLSKTNAVLRLRVQ